MKPTKQSVQDKPIKKIEIWKKVTKIITRHPCRDCKRSHKRCVKEDSAVYEVLDLLHQAQDEARRETVEKISKMMDGKEFPVEFLYEFSRLIGEGRKKV